MPFYSWDIFKSNPTHVTYVFLDFWCMKSNMWKRFIGWNLECGHPLLNASCTPYMFEKISHCVRKPNAPAARIFDQHYHLTCDLAFIAYIFATTMLMFHDCWYTVVAWRIWQTKNNVFQAAVRVEQTCTIPTTVGNMGPNHWLKTLNGIAMKWLQVDYIFQMVFLRHAIFEFRGQFMMIKHWNVHSEALKTRMICSDTFGWRENKGKHLVLILPQI